jgi:hypothetical protein
MTVVMLVTGVLILGLVTVWGIGTWEIRRKRDVHKEG